jgi:ABC-type polysaccharide/polyol phosphate export permease
VGVGLSYFDKAGHGEPLAVGFTVANVQVYQPFHSGLPKLAPYFKQVWRRRAFIAEYSRSELRAQNFGSLFGQLWLIINPLLLALVYFLLIMVIGGAADGRRFAHLTAGLFLFYLVTNALTMGAKSITSGGKLILNSAFPRFILPLSATVISFFKFIPTLVVLAVIALLLAKPISLALLLLPLILLLVLVLALAFALLFATLNVYFRDTKNFLPYLTRAWLYLSPVLYESASLKPALAPLKYINPLAPFIDAWSGIFVSGKAPTSTTWMLMLVWSMGLLLLSSYLFLSREREFALRI